MNILQESREEVWNITGSWQVKTVESRPEAPKSVTLLLHGYNERGLRIFRKIRKYLPKDTYVIAPNGPFPLPRIKPGRIDFGYAWYFYDAFTKTYLVDQSLVIGLLTELLRKANPEGLPVTIIGFSQGGYLAPLVGYAEKNTNHVIGIGCEFRTRFFQSLPNFTLDAIHGEVDPMVSHENARAEIASLAGQGIHVAWHPLPEVKHEIGPEVGSTIKKILEKYGERSL